MEAYQLLTADTLDILFDGRNKSYGAYALRRTYNGRLTTALLLTISLILIFIGGSYIAKGMHDDQPLPVILTDPIELESIHEQEKINEVPPPPPPPQPVEPPKVAIEKFTTITIAKDDDVKANDLPPEVETLEEAKIGTIQQDGKADDGIVYPPKSDDQRGILSGVAKPQETTDAPFIKVEVESQYPGGESAWRRYLNRTFQYPPEAIEKELQGSVVVQFIVDIDGTVSDVTAISGPTEGGLRDEAIRVIKRSGKWTPAIQNGRHVKSYKKQPITFRFQAD